MTEAPLCAHCGAPRTAGLVACSFCATPYAGVSASGIDCPHCHVDNDPTRQICARCGHSLLRTCVFCSRGTIFTAAACASCGEVFEGAELRKKAREEERQRQQMMGIAATGLGVLGQVAASPAGRGLLGQLMNGIKDEIGKG